MATNIPTKAKNHIHQPYKVKQNEMSRKKKQLGIHVKRSAAYNVRVSVLNTENIYPQDI